MVTKYSGRTGSVKGRTKLVLTYSPTSVKNSTSSVKVTAKLYYESTYRTQDSFNTAKMSGSLGSWSGDMSINGTSVHIKTLTKTVSTSYSGSKRITVSASLSGVEASPGSHSVSASITIPKRPVSKPKTPTNVKMALLSDNRTKTTWSHSTSTAQPVSSYTVQYQRLDGGSWTGWMHSATVKGKSYTSNPGTNNKSYRRRVRANNSAGSSGWAYSNYVRMQPYAPVNVRAKVQPSGSDIKVTWDFNNPAETTCFKLQLQRRVNGGSWTTVSSSFGQVSSKPYTSSYTDTNPGAGSNQYRIRILNNCEGDNSVWSESNTVSTIVPPKAPTNLSPDGKVVDFTGDVLFTWQHHDAGDGADQSHYDLRYRAQGESAWTYAPDGGNASEVSEHLFEGGELENGVNYEWQVKTQGNTKEDYGPWSKSAFVTGWTTPVVSIKDGAPPNPLTALPVPLAWTYSQDEGQGQIGWQARLYSVGSGDMFDSILEEKSAESSSTSTEFATAISDGERYGVMVRARSSKGQWSDWSETTFDVELLVPAELRVDLEYGEDTGQMNINIVSDEPVQGETAEVVSIDVQRRINGGEWVPIMVGIPFDSETTLVDNVPSIWGVNEYRVTATTEAPSKGVFGPFRKTVTPYVGNTENWLFLNYGETFDYMLRMQGDLSMSGSYDRSKETQKLLGRKKPISLLGQQLSREHQVTGTVEYYEECEFPDVPDVPRELVGSAFFDDARAWNFSKVQAGPDSQITAEAHYRAKRYGYLMDVVEGNTENLVSPSPRSGVPGSEVPGREVEEVVARNLFPMSKLSEDVSGLSITSTLHTEQIADGLRITNPDGYTGAISLFHQTKAGGVTGIVPGQKYSAAVPLRNDGDDPIMIKVALIERYAGGTSRYSRTNYGQILQPGETRVFLLEDLEAQSADDYLTVTMYYSSSDPLLTEKSALTVLDGITLVADAVAADPFNGDGPVKHDELVRSNLAVNSRFENGTTGWVSSNGSPALSVVSGNRLQAQATGTRNGFDVDIAVPIPVSPGQWLAVAFDADADDESAVYAQWRWGIPGSGYKYSSTDSSLKAAGGVHVVGAFQAPADATTVLARVTFRNGVSDPMVVGSNHWIEKPIFVVADSEDEALSRVQTYFDGDSQDNGLYRYEYEGEPGNSASLEYRVTDVLRRNGLPEINTLVTSGIDMSEGDNGATRCTTNTSATAYLSTSGPYRERIPYTEDTEVLTFRVSVPKDEDPARVRLRTMLYGEDGNQIGDSPDATFDVPNDGAIHEYSLSVPESEEATGIRALLYIRDGENQYTPGNVIDVHTAYLGVDGEPFDSRTEDTYNRLYRKAPDGSSIEVVTDTQSLYRWTGAEADSESEKYLPAAPEHFDEYSKWLNVEPGGTYQLEAFVKAPGLRSVARRNLTSQGQFATDRRLWGSASLRSGLGATWSDESEFEYGAVRLTGQVSTMFPTPTAYLATDVKASTLGVTSLAGAEFTLGIDVYSEEDSGVDQKILIKPMDSAGELVGDWIEQTFRSTQEITRQVMRFTLPVGTESFEIRLTNPVATVLFASNVTFEEGATDGSWIEEETGREWLGAENIDAVQLMVEEFDADGESLSVEAVAELGPEDFSNRWRTLSGEYTVGLGAATVRTWVEWVVNGDHPDLQSDWYFGGMKATNVYVVPERWPGPDSNPDEWREAQYESTTVCLRTPSGHRVFGAMSGLEVSAVEGSLDLSEVSFTVTETDYTENPLVIDESDIWDNIVVDAQDDSFVVQPGEIETQPGFGNIVVNPYSGSDA